MRRLRPAIGRRARSPLALLATAVLLTAGTTACSGNDAGDGDAAEEDGADGPTEAGTAGESLTSGLELPLDAYHIAPEDQQALEDARDGLIRECMERYGQEYAPADHPPPDTDRYTYLYGVDNAEIAAEHGYTHPTDLDPHTYEPVFDEPLTDEQELALYGDPELGEERPQTVAEAEGMVGPELNGDAVPVTGCHGEASLTLNEPDDEWIDPTILHEIQNEAGHHADDDERVTVLLDEWSQCMADRGHDTDSPLTAQEDLGLEGHLSGPEAVEAAVDDVACKAETDLVDRWATVDAEYQEDAIEEHGDLLETLQEQHGERMARATRSP